ncbi:MAG: hypothetical protein AB8B96_10385 [Lysobacterales bacterium]
MMALMADEFFMNPEPPITPPNPAPSRWQLVADVLRFQAKLFVDGLRDLLMSPISLVAALYGLLVEPENPRRLFDRVLDFGRETEVWINLFGRQSDKPGIDDLFANLEERMRQQVDQGGMTAAAKQKIDQSLDRLHERVAGVDDRPTEADTAAGSDEAKP